MWTLQVLEAFRHGDEELLKEYPGKFPQRFAAYNDSPSCPNLPELAILHVATGQVEKSCSNT